MLNCYLGCAYMYSMIYSAYSIFSPKLSFKPLNFDVGKKLFKLPKLRGGGGGREFGQNPKEQHFFSSNLP